MISSAAYWRGKWMAAECWSFARQNGDATRSRGSFARRAGLLFLSLAINHRRRGTGALRYVNHLTNANVSSYSPEQQRLQKPDSPVLVQYGRLFVPNVGLLQEFKSNRHPVMLATDVAARGLGRPPAEQQQFIDAFLFWPAFLICLDH